MATGNRYGSSSQFSEDLGGGLSNLGSAAGAWLGSKWGDFNSWYKGWGANWGANAANAAVTGVFTALGSIAGLKTSEKVYNYYRMQEEAAISNAMEMARRIQLKGDIELLNLKIKHRTMEGKNELAAAASGGQLSGSFLDKLVQNYKYDMMDERTQSIQTLWDKSNAIRSGYISAMQSAGAAMQYAYKQQGSALQGATSALKAMSGALLKDYRAKLMQDARYDILNITEQDAFDENVRFYGDSGHNAGITGIQINYDTADGVASNLSDNPYGIILPKEEGNFTKLTPWDANFWLEGALDTLQLDSGSAGLRLDNQTMDSLLKFNA